MTDIQDTASLEVLDGQMAGQRFELGGEAIIGRCDGGPADCHCQVCLSDDRVSRRHAHIVRRGEGYVIQDMGSTNGTLLNARRLKPGAWYPLREGSNLQVGGVHLRFRPAVVAGQRPRAGPAWESEIGENEEAFDLALIVGESPAEEQDRQASLLLVSESPPPDQSLAIDARDALKVLRQSLDEEHEAVGEVNRRLRALAQVSMGLGEPRTREDLLARVMDFIFDIFPAAERAYGLVRTGKGDPDDPHPLRPVVAMSRQGEEKMAVRLSRGIVEEVMRRRKAVLSQDAQKDRRFDAQASVIAQGVRSVMSVPLLLDDEVLGLIQVENHLAPQAFDRNDLDILAGIGMQTAIALKNLGLVEDIQNLFEGFVTASVHAIEARDPATSGHSFRVAEYSQRLARAVSRCNEPGLRDVSFTEEQLNELRYAALLHDFGKVGVREHVLTKANKLYPRQFELMQMRFRLARVSLERQAYRRLVEEAESHPLSPGELRERRRRLEQELAAEIRRLRDFMAVIEEANQPSVSLGGVSPALENIRGYTFPDEEGREVALLSEFELESLTLGMGSLTREERRQIQSHVQHTYDFLVHIPWTASLGNVPEIAYKHHEKLDGSGYPQGLQADEIPLQARILTVVDIYDALTAGDRPYKQSLPEERALDILRDEVRTGKVDGALVDIFIDSGIYRQKPQPVGSAPPTRID